MTMRDAVRNSYVVAGTHFVNSIHAKVLIDYELQSLLFLENFLND